MVSSLPDVSPLLSPKVLLVIPSSLWLLSCSNTQLESFRSRELYLFLNRSSRKSGVSILKKFTNEVRWSWRDGNDCEVWKHRWITYLTSNQGTTSCNAHATCFFRRQRLVLEINLGSSGDELSSDSLKCSVLSADSIKHRSPWHNLILAVDTKGGNISPLSFIHAEEVLLWLDVSLHVGAPYDIPDAEQTLCRKSIRQGSLSGSAVSYEDHNTC